MEIFKVYISDLQPSQLYLSELKLKLVEDLYKKEANIPPIPIKI